MFFTNASPHIVPFFLIEVPGTSVVNLLRSVLYKLSYWAIQAVCYLWVICVLFLHQINFVFLILVVLLVVFQDMAMLFLCCLLYCKYRHTTKMSQATTGSHTEWWCVVCEDGSKTDYSSVILQLKYKLQLRITAKFRTELWECINGGIRHCG